MRNVLDLPLFSGVPAQIAPEPEPKYPAAPGFRGAYGAPSHMAAKEAAMSCTALRGEVVEYLQGLEAKFGAAFAGVTSDEIADALGRAQRSIQPRVSELAKLGWIEKCPTLGRSALGSPATRWRLSGAA